MSAHRLPRNLPRLLIALCLLSLSAGQPARAEGPPPNDDFANATVIDALPFEAEGDLVDATLEPNEPGNCEGAERTIWFRFDATVDDDVVASLSGLYGPELAVFEARTDGSLDLLGCGEYDKGSVMFPFVARAGNSYLISIGTYYSVDIGYRFSLEHDDLGRIKGTVTAEGAPLEDGCVSAELIQEEPDQETYVGRAAHARPDGTFHLGALPTGDYTISFSECAWPSTYLTEWYDDRPSQDLATAVHVEAGGTLQGINADLALGGVVSGLVTDEAGQPLEGICINDGSAETDANGRYRLTGLPTGTVKVGFSDAACERRTRYLGEWWSDKPDRDSANAVPVVAGEETTGIDAQLALGGWISGRVTDDAGEPLSNICVAIPSENGGGYSEFDTTDETGTYLLSPLKTGDFKIRFWDCGHGDSLEEWFDDAPDKASATTVPVTVGEGTAANATLSQGGSIAGRVVDPDGGPLFTVCITLYLMPSDPGSPFFTYADSTHTNTGGTYRFNGLAPGEYLVRYEECLSDKTYATEWYDDARNFSDATVIRVAGGQDILGIDAMLDDPSVIIAETSDSTDVSESGGSDS